MEQGDTPQGINPGKSRVYKLLSKGTKSTVVDKIGRLPDWRFNMKKIIVTALAIVGALCILGHIIDFCEAIIKAKADD